MANTVECNHRTDWSPVSDRTAPIANDKDDEEKPISDAAARLDRLDAQAEEIRLSLLKMYVYRGHPSTGR